MKLLKYINAVANRVVRRPLSLRERELLSLGSYTEEWILPRNVLENDPLSFVPSAWFDEQELNFNLPAQLTRLERWNRDYQHIFEILRADPNINKEFLGEQYLHNHYYPTPDAETYAAMILDVKPAQIIEIGSGFSTLIARKSIEAAGLDTKVTVIDPSPRTDINNAADRVLLKFVEDLKLSEIDITHSTLLFIDSSHICRGRGDVPFLYCNLIPRLPSGVFVHVHDVYLPYDYPTAYLKRAYTEQYMLYLTLLHPDRYEIVFTTHYLSRKYPQNMQSTFGSIVGTHNRFFGGCLWFRVK